MQDTKYCSSCKKTKPAGDFIHPRTGKDKKTCAECIMKRSAAAKREAPLDTTATLQLHTTCLDDHEQRIACVEETLYDYDAAGAPPAPDAPGAGDGTFTKSQLRRQKRKNKKAARAAARALDFVLVGNDAASDSTDLDSLASTHSCVRALVEENRQLTADLRGMRGMRLLLRDPSFLQRVGRGMVGRSRAKSRLAAVRKIQVLVRRRAKCKFVAIIRLQAWVRASLHASLWRKCRRSLVGLQGRARVRMARKVCHHKRCIRSSIVIAAAWRRYHVLSTTLFGKLLSKTRRLAKGLSETKVALVASRRNHEDTLQSLEKELTILKSFLDEAQTKLTKANEVLAANERELKNAVHATLCANPPTEVTVVKGASPLMKNLSKFLQAFKNLGCDADISNLQPAVAQLITKDLKIEVYGNNVCNHENWKNNKDWHRGFIKEVHKNGKFKVQFDTLTGKGVTTPWTNVLKAKQFRIV